MKHIRYVHAVTYMMQASDGNSLALCFADVSMLWWYKRMVVMFCVCGFACLICLERSAALWDIKLRELPPCLATAASATSRSDNTMMVHPASLQVEPSILWF